MKMRVEISDECVRCGLCVDACPRGAVKSSGEEFVIDGSLCDQCCERPEGKACALECPVEALYTRRD